MLKVYRIFNLLDGTQALKQIKSYKSWTTFFTYYVPKHPYSVSYVCNRFGVWTRVTGSECVYAPDCFLPRLVEGSRFHIR